jgi:hypothetical protein
MGIRVEHELHTRRLGRNIGLGLLLLAFVGLVFMLTVAKVTRGDYEPPRGDATQTQQGGN